MTSKDLKERFIKSCETIVENNGTCNKVDCADCPGGSDYNDHIFCTDNGWSSSGGIDERDDKLLESAKKYLEENKVEQKIDDYNKKKHDKGKVRYDLIEWNILEDVRLSGIDGLELSDIYKDFKTEVPDFLSGCITLAIIALGGYDNFLYELARVYTFGAEKYGDMSWKTVPNGKQRYTAALHRHLRNFKRGEFLNYEDGMLYHVAQAAWNAIAILWFMDNKEQE